MKRNVLRTLIAGTAAAAMVLGSMGCFAEEAEAVTETDAAEAEAVTETGAAETEADAGEKEAPKDQAILVVSFGTSYNDSRDLTIGVIEEAIAEAYPDYDVRRAFTSQIIIDKLAERDGLDIDNVQKALDRAVEDGVKTLIVQPTHLMNGLEYTDVVEEVAQYADQFDAVAMGEPLLTSDADYEAVIQAITEATADYDDGETAICFMGHGTEAESNSVYAAMQEKLTEAGYENYFVGTVEAEPTLEDVLAAVGEGEYTKAVLAPLMIVAGDHANNDMAGDEEGSWKTEFTNAGYEVTCLVQGLGELDGIQQIFVEHTQAAIDSLSE